jgi:quinol monooxygenase YgiN
MSDEASSPSGPPESGEVVVALTLRFKPRTADAVLAGIIPSIAPTRAEKGNRQFDVFRVTAEPDTLVIVERWKDRHALQDHWQLPYTQQALALFEENLAEPLTDGRNVLYLTDMAGIQEQ